MLSELPITAQYSIAITCSISKRRAGIDFSWLMACLLLVDQTHQSDLQRQIYEGMPRKIRKKGEDVLQSSPCPLHPILPLNMQNVRTQGIPMYELGVGGDGDMEEFFLLLSRTT